MMSITNALNGFLNRNNNFCCLCFTTISDEAIRLEDEVELKENSYNTTNTVTVSKILQCILGDKTDDCVTALKTLCKQCTNSAINSYSFTQMCKSNIEYFSKTLDGLTNSISYTTEELDDSKTLFVSLNMNDFTSIHFYDNKRPVNNLSSALRRIRSIDKKITAKEHSIKKQKTNLKYNGIKSEKKLRIINPLLTSDMILDKDDKTSINCKECFKEFSSIWNLRNHYIRVHAPKIYQCSVCPRSYGSAAFLEAHKTESHCTAVCSECGKTFNNRHTLKMHEIGHNTNIVCSDCGRVYKNKTTYKRHIDINLCGRKSRAHPDEGKYICDYCKKRYSQKMSLRVHIQHEHGNYKGHSCEWCGKKFWAQSRLKAHIVKHTKEKNYPCTTCGGRFVTKESLLYHTRTHTGERPYSCPHCDTMFVSASRRAEHIRRLHVSDTIYECRICFTKFGSKTILRNHKRIHNLNITYDKLKRRLSKEENKIVKNEFANRNIKIENTRNDDDEKHAGDGDIKHKTDNNIYLEVSDDEDYI